MPAFALPAFALPFLVAFALSHKGRPILARIQCLLPVAFMHWMSRRKAQAAKVDLVRIFRTILPEDRRAASGRRIKVRAQFNAIP